MGLQVLDSSSILQVLDSISISLIQEIPFCISFSAIKIINVFCNAFPNSMAVYRIRQVSQILDSAM